MFKSKKLVMAVTLTIMVGAASLLMADTYSYWCGTGTGECQINEHAVFKPWTNWCGTWNETENTFSGSWWCDCGSGDFDGTVTSTGSPYCTHVASGTWSLDVDSYHFDPAGDFEMYFCGDYCYGSWDASYIEGLDCEGTMSGTKQQ